MVAKVVISCLFCQTQIERDVSQYEKSGGVFGQHFCSNSCAARINNKGKIKNPPIERKCTKCQGAFFHKGLKRSRLCEKCRADKIRKKEDRSKLTLAEVLNRPRLQGKHSSWRNQEVRQINREMNRDLQEHPCQLCGYALHVELAHIIAISQFPVTATMEVINHKDNILALCRNHHWELDKDLLQISDIPMRKEQKTRPVPKPGLRSLIEQEAQKELQKLNQSKPARVPLEFLDFG